MGNREMQACIDEILLAVGPNPYPIVCELATDGG